MGAGVKGVTSAAAHAMGATVGKPAEGSSEPEGGSWNLLLQLFGPLDRSWAVYIVFLIVFLVGLYTLLMQITVRVRTRRQ